MKKKPKHSMEKAFWLKNLFLIACLLFTATPGFSQNKTVTGTVTDATGETAHRSIRTATRHFQRCHYGH